MFRGQLAATVLAAEDAWVKVRAVAWAAEGAFITVEELALMENILVSVLL